MNNMKTFTMLSGVAAFAIVVLGGALDSLPMIVVGTVCLGAALAAYKFADPDGPWSIGVTGLVVFCMLVAVIVLANYAPVLALVPAAVAVLSWVVSATATGIASD